MTKPNHSARPADDARQAALPKRRLQAQIARSAGCLLGEPPGACGRWPGGGLRAVLFVRLGRFESPNAWQCNLRRLSVAGAQAPGFAQRLWLWGRVWFGFHPQHSVSFDNPTS
jgi:hypothetical protein